MIDVYSVQVRMERKRKHQERMAADDKVRERRRPSSLTWRKRGEKVLAGESRRRSWRKQQRLCCSRRAFQVNSPCLRRRLSLSLYSLLRPRERCVSLPIFRQNLPASTRARRVHRKRGRVFRRAGWRGLGRAGCLGRQTELCSGRARCHWGNVTGLRWTRRACLRPQWRSAWQG